jgi:hypothetical protein
MENRVVRSTKKSKANRLKHGGPVVIDAADRFASRRRDAEIPQAKTPPSGPAAKPKESRKVRVLKPRVERDASCAFILAKDEAVLDENGVRCVPFIVVEAPHHPADDQRFLTPYRLRGWDCVLFADPDDPTLPCALPMQADPYQVFEAALLDLPKEKRSAYRRESGYKLYHFVADPLG